jgi:16S rRNA (adenine1518-N6/adenine1519-N6)-dimethyltransferase
MTAALPALKKWGQHFLVDRSVLERIAEACALSETASVLEIGPGEGALTRELARSRARLVAVEIDPLRAEALQSEFAGDPRVKIFAGDALSAPFSRWLIDGGLDLPAVFAGNLPYNISTVLLSRAIEEAGVFVRIIATVQKEVARRFTARPGSEHYGFLSVRSAFFADAEVLFDIKPGSFRPRPNVDSSVIRLLPKKSPVAAAKLSRLLEVVSWGFRSRRKTLANALSGLSGKALFTEALERIGKSPRARAEELSPEDFVALLDAVDAVS